MGQYEDEAKKQKFPAIGTIGQYLRLLAESRKQVQREPEPDPAKLKLVIAGNFDQYMHWLKEKGLNRQQAVYVRDVKQLKNHRPQDVVLVYVGDYFSNPLYNEPYLLWFVRKQQEAKKPDDRV